MIITSIHNLDSIWWIIMIILSAFILFEILDIIFMWNNMKAIDKARITYILSAIFKTIFCIFKILLFTLGIIILLPF